MDPLQMLYPQSNPQDDYEDAIKYMQPFYDTGVDAMGNYQNAINRMIRHPAGLENRVMATYHMSPYAQYQSNTLNQMAGNQAAQAGNLGTPDQQQALMTQEQGIVSKDQQDYLRNAMMPYHWGLQGDQFLTQGGEQAGKAMGMQKDLEAMMSAKQSAMGLGVLGSLFGAIPTMMKGAA